MPAAEHLLCVEDFNAGQLFIRPDVQGYLFVQPDRAAFLWLVNQADVTRINFRVITDFQASSIRRVLSNDTLFQQ